MTDNSVSLTNKIKATLAVLEFEGAPGSITAILRVNPTKTWMKGTPVTSGAQNVHHQNGWAVHSEVFSRMSDVDVAVRQVLDNFPSARVFQNLPDECEVQMTITIFGRRDRPGVWLSPETMKRLGAIGASLDVDTYDLTSAEDTSD